MVAVTYGVARVGTADIAAKIAPKVAPKIVPKIAPMTAIADQTVARKSWFVRFFDAMVQARMQQAHREIRMHTELLPYGFDERGNRLIKTESGDMPLGGW